MADVFDSLPEAKKQVARVIGILCDGSEEDIDQETARDAMAETMSGSLPGPVEFGIEGQDNVVRLLSADEDRPDVVWATVSFANSDGGEPNQVMTLGHNRAGTGGKQTAGRHSFHLGLEREFWDGSARQCEYYIQYVAADDSVTIRPFAANINTTTHACMLGLRGEQRWTNSAGTLNATYTETGQLTLLGSGAMVGIAPAAATLPSAGLLRLSGNGSMTWRANSVDVTALQVTETPNLILGGVGNTVGTFIDAGSSQAITLRPNAASHTVAITSTAATFQMPVRLPTYTVAAAPGANAGSLAYFSDGDAGSPCLAVHDGTSWKRVALGAAVSAT